MGCGGKPAVVAMWWNMRLVVLLVALADFTSSHPAKESTENAHAPQYDFVKCCPCPGSEFWEQLAAGQVLGARQALDGASGNVEQCTCKGRDADATGEPSLLTPRTLIPIWSDLRPQDANDDGKTLLQPEVDMASKVLETLREATDEEYQDALARDAARSANGDDTAKPIVTIILNPHDDPISEASQAQEARLAPPQGSNLGQTKETIPSLLKPLHKLFDLDNSANSVKEKVASLGKGLEGLKLKNNPTVLSLLPGKDKNSVLEEAHLKNVLKLNELGSKLFKNAKNVADDVKDNDSKKIFDLKTPLLRRAKPLNARKQAKEVGELDASPASTVLKEQTTERDSKSPIDLKSLLPRKDTSLTKTPLSLSNLLNLKDVELLPAKPLKLNLPTLKLLPSNRIQKIGKIKKSENCNKEVKGEVGDAHKTLHTEILDALPSPSEHKLIINSEADIPEHLTDDISKANDIRSSKEFEGTTETAQNIFAYSEPHVESDNDGLEITISSDGDTEIENITIERGIDQPQTDIIQSEEFQEDNIEDGPEQDASSETVDISQIPLSQGASDEESAYGEALENEEHLTSEEEGTSNIPEENVQSEEIADVIPATSNDAFQFASDESESDNFDSAPDFEFRSVNPLEENGESVNSGSIENEPNIIDEATNFDFKSAELNNEEDRSADPEENSSPESSQEHLQLENSETRTKTMHQEDTKIPSVKERISIKLRTLKNSKPKVLSVPKINRPSKIVDEEAQEPLISESSDFESTHRESQMPFLDKGSSEGLPSGKSESAKDLPDVTTAIANKKVNGDDMALSATSNELIVENIESSETFPKDGPCPCNQIPKDTSGLQEQDMANDDSNTGASLRQDVIVQPSSLFDGGSLFNRPLLPALPPLNLETHIPTLDELNSRISGLLPLDGFARDASNDGSDEDCSDVDSSPKMSPSASTASLNSLLPPLRPLQDINLDIFQLSPLGASGPLSHKIPSLNLNTFKTKLALPEHLGLKPLELRSSLGNKKNGLLGATLRFGPAKIGSQNRGSEISGNPLGSLPSIDEIRDTMKSSASNLLKSPMVLPSSSILGDNLPTIDDISERLRSHSENLRAHTENTAKNIQDTLSSTLSDSKLVKLGTSKSKFAKSKQENVLEKLALAHDDMNDKLRAIHFDFTDRLTSLHDDILENAKLPKLKLPHAKSATDLSNMMPLTKTLVTRKQSSSSKKSSQRKTSRPSLSTGRLASSHSKPISDHSKSIKPFKLSKAASSLQPKSIEVPKLTATSIKPPFAWPFQKADAIMLREREPLTSSTRLQPLKESRIPLLKPLKPLGDVKITIGTTPRPTTSKVTTAKPTRLVPKSKGRESTTPKTTRPTLAQRLQATKDLKGFSSDAHSSRVRPTTISRQNLEHMKPTSRSQVTEGPKLKTTKKAPVSGASHAKLAVPKETPASKKGTISKTTLKSPKTTASSSLLTSSKTTESPVISKLREALKVRLATKPKAPEKLFSPVRSPVDQDMLRSASENNAITVVQKDAMQENVTYKCKMMCVKER